MSEISIDGTQILHLSNELEPYVDDVYGALKNIPSVDGGIASNMIAIITSVGAEASQVVPDSYLALMALAREVVKDFAANDEDAAQALRSYEAEIEQS